MPATGCVSDDTPLTGCNSSPGVAIPKLSNPTTPSIHEPVTVQVVTSNAACREARFEEASKNDGVIYEAKVVAARDGLG